MPTKTRGIHRPPTHPTARAAALCAAVLIAGAALTACGSPDGTGPEKGTAKGVDTLVTDTPSAKDRPSPKSSAAAVDDKRPQLRLDTSDEERDRLGDAYNACLQAHGVPMNTERAQAAGKKQAPPLQSPEIGRKYKAAFDACLVKLPRQPPETQPDTNPRYADDYRDYVKCLQKRGMKIHMVPDTSVYPDGLGWTFDGNTAGIPASKEPKAERDCTMEAFGGKG